MQRMALDLLTCVSWYHVVAGTAAAVAVGIIQLSRRPDLNAFPTAGSSGGWLGSWQAGIKCMTNAADIIKEYNGAPFKIATLYHWVVVFTSRAHLEELQHAREDEFSFRQAINEDFNFEYLLGSELYKDIYHVSVMRSQLPREIGVLYAELRDEIVTAFDEVLDLDDNGWKSIPALTAVQRIVCRASNRSFVGLPLCRDPDYVALNIQYTIDAVMGDLIVGVLPVFFAAVSCRRSPIHTVSQLLDSLAARFNTNVPKNMRLGLDHLRPIMEERRKYLNEYGKEWTEKPIIPDASAESLTKRVLTTSANVFTNALYNLAANPQYAQLLREEVEAIVEKGGRSKTSLSKMRKLDSFLKESIRIDGIDALGLTRKAAKDFTFSDRTFIPKGTRINAGLIGLHYNEALYGNPEAFNPFRFADMGEEGGEGAKHQFIATSPEYLAFGHGQHACPGRFFAGAELKTMLAHVVTTYDVKLEEGTTRPRSLRIGNSIGANPTAEVLFRNRGCYGGA